jgi:hypothetical protein
MIRSRLMNDDPTRESFPDVSTARRPRPRRALNAFDRCVRIPIGLVWLGVLATAAVPVFIYMTVLYWIVRAASSPAGGRRAQRTDRTDTDARVA